MGRYGGSLGKLFSNCFSYLRKIGRRTPFEIKGEGGGVGGL